MLGLGLSFAAFFEGRTLAKTPRQPDFCAGSWTLSSVGLPEAEALLASAPSLASAAPFDSFTPGVGSLFLSEFIAMRGTIFGRGTVHDILRCDFSLGALRAFPNPKNLGEGRASLFHSPRPAQPPGPWRGCAQGSIVVKIVRGVGPSRPLIPITALVPMAGQAPYYSVSMESRRTPLNSEAAL